MYVHSRKIYVIEIFKGAVFKRKNHVVLQAMDNFTDFVVKKIQFDFRFVTFACSLKQLLY